MSDDFISEDDLHTFDGFMKYQAIDPTTLLPADLAQWHGIFEDAMARSAAVKKVGLMKLQSVPGEQKYAVAVEDGSDLWLALWVRFSRRGEVFVMLPTAGRGWDAHTSYHRDGTFHTKSHGHAVFPPKQKQPLDAAFKGAEYLGVYGGSGGRTVGAVCDPAAFTGLVWVTPGILGARGASIAVDLVAPAAPRCRSRARRSSDKRS